MIIRKSPSQIEKMAKAGKVVADLHEMLRELVRPGISTGELDERAEAELRSRGAGSSFKGYMGASSRPFPAVLCTSVNDEIVHGIPSRDAVLAEGDLVKIDAGAIVDGYHGDSAATWIVGGDDVVAPEVRRLVEVTRAGLWAGLGAARRGGRLGDVSAAVEAVARPHAYGVVQGYGGHGIGQSMHEDPHVPNHGRPGRGPKLAPGLVLAVEPMFNLGGAETETLDDDWTVVTADGSLSSHWEHTVAVTPDGPWVLTARSDEPAWPLAEPARVPSVAA